MKLKLYYDRQSVGQSVLVSGSHLGPMTRFLLSLWWLRVFYMEHPLWREDWSVSYCTVPSGPCQSSHSWVEVPQNSRPYFIVSSETPPTWRTKSPYLYPPRTGVAQLYPRALGSLFVASYDSQGGILTRLHTGFLYGSKSKSHYHRQLVDQSVLVSGPHPGPATNFFSFSLTFSMDICGFGIL
jgi:hypothetical protein